MARQIGFLALLLGLASACTALRPTVTLTNGSPWPLTGAELSLRGAPLWSGDLAPGASVERAFTPGDGSFRLTGTLDGAPLTVDSLGYTTNGDTQRHTLSVMPDRSVSYKAAQ